MFDAQGARRGGLSCDPGLTRAAAASPSASPWTPAAASSPWTGWAGQIEVLTPSGARARPFRSVCGGLIAVAAPGPGRGPEQADLRGLRRRAGRLRGARARRAPASRWSASLPGGAFRGPAAVAVNPDESALAIVDPGAERQVSVYGSDGQVAVLIRPARRGRRHLLHGERRDLGPGGTLWVTDTVRHSISVFDTQGTYLGRIGGFGRGPGQFDYPSGCAFLRPTVSWSWSGREPASRCSRSKYRHPNILRVRPSSKEAPVQPGRVSQHCKGGIGGDEETTHAPRGGPRRCGSRGVVELRGRLHMNSP